MDADIFAIQETKMQDGQADLQKNGYYYYLNSAIRKGYSGTLIYTKEKPLNVTYGLGLDKHNDEGRVITLEYDHFILLQFIRQIVKKDYKGFHIGWNLKMI